jgi:hypothetical protein
MTDLGLENLSFVQSQTVGFSNNRHYVYNLGELFHNNDVNGAKRMATRVDKEEATVNSGILDIAFTSCGQLFA